MKIVVLIAIAAGLVGIPAVAIAQFRQAADPVQHSLIVRHTELPPAACTDVKAMLARRGITRSDPCQITSVMEQWESGVGTSPKAVDAQLAASGCNVFKRKSCPFSTAHKVRWHLNECWGMFDNCTKHDSPVWWKVQQSGRYYKGWPCRVSRWIPGPYNCRRYYTWTRDYTWRWRHFNPPNRSGFHRCNSVSGSGFATSIDSCYRVKGADPSGTPNRFPYSNSGHGRVGMVFTACSGPGSQCRTYRVNVGLYPGAKGARRGR